MNVKMHIIRVSSFHHNDQCQQAFGRGIRMATIGIMKAGSRVSDQWRGRYDRLMRDNARQLTAGDALALGFSIGHSLSAAATAYDSANAEILYENLESYLLGMDKAADCHLVTRRQVSDIRAMIARSLPVFIETSRPRPPKNG